MLCRMKIIKIAKGTVSSFCVPQVMNINKVCEERHNKHLCSKTVWQMHFQNHSCSSLFRDLKYFQFRIFFFYSLLLPLQYYFLDFQQSALFCFYGILMFDIPSVL